MGLVVAPAAAAFEPALAWKCDLLRKEQRVLAWSSDGVHLAAVADELPVLCESVNDRFCLLTIVQRVASA